MSEPDERKRCFGSGDALYAAYHDSEWGRPVHDDCKLFEMLTLEGAQAGLSWRTVLGKREGYRNVFHGFDIDRVAAMTDAELAAAVENPAIIRHRLKVASVRKNARAVQHIQRQIGSFDAYVWAFVDGQPIVNTWSSFKDIPALTPHSDRLSKDLKKRGMSFVGSTIVYAFMQAAGLVDDHLVSCWLRSGTAS